MFKYFQDYYWKAGKPYGIKKVDPFETPICYKMIVDPYYKRFSIERYCNGLFERILYDSILLDFRHLTEQDQIGWQRELLQEDNNQTICLLRNQEDRAILLEILTFEHQLCRSCSLKSVHGILLSTHHMYYKSLQDPFNGVILFDVEKRPVMMKTYEINSQTGEFTQLLNEEWNMQTLPPLLIQEV